VHTYGVENVPRETLEAEIEKTRATMDDLDATERVERRTVTVEGGNRAARRKALKSYRKRGAGFTRSPEETR
jgi:hypothetical protein